MPGERATAFEASTVNCLTLLGRVQFSPAWILRLALTIALSDRSYAIGPRRTRGGGVSIGRWNPLRR